jgi:hypothetical protein
MTAPATISLEIGTTNPLAPLGVEIWLDQDLLFDVDHVKSAFTFMKTLADIEATHELRIVLKNKLPEHTRIDSQGNITEDARICVNQLSFDEIELKQILIEKAVYSHNNNGATDTVTETFYGEMGCNGTVSLSFTTPIYLWLLENM